MEFNYLRHLIYNLVVLIKCLRVIGICQNVGQNFTTDTDALT